MLAFLLRKRLYFEHNNDTRNELSYSRQMNFMLNKNMLNPKTTLYNKNKKQSKPTRRHVHCFNSFTLFLHRTLTYLTGIKLYYVVVEISNKGNVNCMDTIVLLETSRFVALSNIAR